MTIKHKIAIAVLNLILRLMCRIDNEQLKRVPGKGPLIMVVNHINIIDVPLLLVYLYPRYVTALVKIEAWDNPFFRILLNMWEAVPVRRGETDLTAMRQSVQTIKKGWILGVSPEGTRSGDGSLLPARAGMVLLALQTDAPLIPVGYYGHENLWANLRRLRRSDFHFVVGRPFHLDPHGEKVTHLVRQQMLDEIMYQLAALLPPANRGAYSNLEAASEKYLAFLPNPG
jgi:1-acyl-sn-glycerol-3-phosphate acyltransferase